MRQTNRQIGTDTDKKLEKTTQYTKNVSKNMTNILLKKKVFRQRGHILHEQT